MSRTIGVGRMPTREEETPVIPLTPDEAREKAAYIRRVVAEVEGYMQQRKPRRDIELRVPEFRDNYPALFETIVNPASWNNGFYKKTLRIMLGMLDKIAEAKMTQERASEILGVQGYEAYVKPTVDALPKDDTSSK
jgi:pyruvate dehydrogenase complex dehydrogenase (E1) component